MQNDPRSTQFRQGQADRNAHAGNSSQVNYDQQSSGLLIVYSALANQQRATAGQLPDAIRMQVDEYLGQIASYVATAQHLPAILPPPTFDEYVALDGSMTKTRRKDKADDYQKRAVATRTEFANQLQALAGQPADAIVEQAFSTCIPPQQPNCDDGAVNERKRDLDALLSAQGGNFGASITAQQTIRTAVAEHDALTLYCLIGTPLRFVRQRLGLNDMTLQTVAFNAQMTQIRAEAFPGSLPAGDISSPLAPQGAAFLQLQLEPDTRLNNVARAASEYFQYQLNYTRSLLTGL